MALDMFAALKAKDLVGGRMLYTLKGANTIEDAVKLLSDNKILSAPVLDEAGKCIGVVDMLDILSYVDSVAPADDRPDFTRKQHEEERSLAGLHMRGGNVKQVMDFSGKNPLFSASFENASLLDIAKLCCGGAKRVVLLDSAGNMRGYITQADIIRYIWQNMEKDEFKDLKIRTMTQLGYVTRPLEMISENDPVKDAIRQLHKLGGGALPIVDGTTGKLVGNFSPSDLKGLFIENQPRFTQSVFGFIKRYSPRAADVLKTVTAETSYQEALQGFVLTKVHHKWIVNSSNHPIGVISLRDMIDFCFRHYGVEVPSGQMPTSAPLSKEQPAAPAVAAPVVQAS
jgi:CBS domain-containing protein